MSDKTELQTEVNATEGLSSTEGAMIKRLVILAEKNDVKLKAKTFRSNNFINKTDDMARFYLDFKINDCRELLCELKTI